MGWTFTHAKYYKSNGQVDRKREIDDLYTWGNDKKQVSVVKSQMVGSDYFAAIKVVEDGKATVEAVMCLTAGKDRHNPYFNFGYKSIPHVDSDHCPMSIIKLLTEPEDEREKKWREECKAYADKTKLKDLPVGTIIRYTLWNGKEYILEKMAPQYQFKRAWWYNADSNTYMPSRRIPDSWEVVGA